MSERHVIDDRNRHENVNGTTRITKNFSNELAMEARHYCIRGRRKRFRGTLPFSFALIRCLLVTGALRCIKFMSK